LLSRSFFANAKSNQFLEICVANNFPWETAQFKGFARGVTEAVLVVCLP
jgi:hypothetical protein